MLTLLEMEFRRRMAAQPQLDMRNALAEAGLRGKIDPATGMARSDPYSKIEGEGGRGGIVAADADAKRNAGPLQAAPRSDLSPQQRVEQRRTSRRESRELRRMPVEERRETELRRSIERDPEFKRADMLRTIGRERQREEQREEIGRGVDLAQGARVAVASRGDDLIKSGATVQDAVRTMIAEVDQIDDPLEQAARMEEIDRWADETRSVRESREQRDIRRGQAARAQEAHDINVSEAEESRAMRQAQEQAARIMRESADAVPVTETETVTRRDPETGEEVRQQVEVELTPGEWAERAYRELAAQVDDSDPNAPRIRDAIYRQVQARAQAMQKQKVAEAEAVADQYDAQLKEAREGRLAMQSLVSMYMDVTTRLTTLFQMAQKSQFEGQDVPEDVAAAMNKLSGLLQMINRQFAAGGAPQEG